MNKVLNLVHPEKSEIQYTLTTFPDGEPHIVLNDFNAKWDVTIKCRIRNPNELFILCEVLDILNRNGVYPIVEIYYLMSMRMDRVMDITRPFSLKIVCDILNTFKASYRVFMVHSNKTFTLLKDSFRYSHKIETFDKIKSEADGIRDDSNFEAALILFPDSSAHVHFSFIEPKHLVGTVDKVRDVNTGLIQIQLSNAIIEKVKTSNTIWILDDLIDGGATIDLLCNEIKKVNNSVKINVFAYHCVNIEGVLKLTKNHKNLHLYTTNSYIDWDNTLILETIADRLHVENIID